MKLITLGRISPEKGQLLMLQSIKHLKGADPVSFKFLENGYVIDNNVKKCFPKGVKSKVYRALYNSK